MNALLAHTPLWVYAILALLVERGVNASRPNSVTPLRLFILPLVFSVLGAMALARTGAQLPVALAACTAGLAVGAGAGWRLFADSTGYAWDGAQLARPGSWRMLAASLSAFLIKFGVSSALGWHPELAASAQGAALAGAAAGLTSGLLWGACATQMLLGRTVTIHRTVEA